MNRAGTAALGAGVVLTVAAAWVGPMAVALAAAMAVNVVAATLMVQRARHDPGERDVWIRWAGAACAAPCAGVLAYDGETMLAAAVSVAVFPLAYGAAVRWNRYATSSADPHELMNGAASAIAVIAAADLLTQLTGSPLGELAWTQRLIVWAPLACALIILGTLLNVIPISGLARDPRAWLMTPRATQRPAAVRDHCPQGRSHRRAHPHPPPLRC